VNSKLPLPAAPVLIAGLGRAGQAAMDLMTKVIGSDAVFGWDANNSNGIRRTAAHWRARGVKVLLGGNGTDALRAAGPSSTIIKSPGISMDVPLLQAAAEQGLNVIDELEVGWRVAAEPVIAVTGTNGKSTTCALIGSILFAAGRTAQQVGNTQFGPPLSRARSGALIVCEVSSFQLESAPTFLPEIAVFTNLTPEHLPRHGTMNAYGDTKQIMFVRKRRTCGLAIINADDARGRQILAAVQDCGGRALTYGFSPDADVRIFEAKWTMREANTSVLINNRVVGIPSKLPGRHNALNIAAACAFGVGSGIKHDVIVAGLGDAAAVPGRFELIDENQPFDVVIDFAHNPDGILAVSSCSDIGAKNHTTNRVRRCWPIRSA
jgi:UDP-N-acetylmuramoylalanine-D-glutamate ligase